VRRLRIFGALVLACAVLSGCSVAPPRPTDQASALALLKRLSPTRIPDPCGRSNYPSPPYSVPYSKLAYITRPPVSGAAGAAWAYFQYVNNNNYAAAAASTVGLLTDIVKANDFLYPRDSRKWVFVEMANITKYVPPESDAIRYYKYKIYYLATVMYRRGLMSCSQTAIRSGLVQWAISVVQERAGGPWYAVLQQFAPPNPEFAKYN